MHFSIIGTGVNMYSMINTSTVVGIHGVRIQVEVDVSSGMPTFEMVGYLSSEVKEARDRVRTALHNCGIVLPAKRITVNMAPANIRKTGTGFDLPIAVALMMSMEIIDEKMCQNRLFVGELSLNGRILPVNGILPLVADAVKEGIKEFIVPRANLLEAKLVKEAKIYAFDELSELIVFLNGGEYKEGDESENIVEEIERTLDFSEVNGQQLLKHACEVSACGMHNLLMVGPPGAGKTMVSERMPTILPPLTEEEKLELSKIYSVSGRLDSRNALLDKRPFRNPHHTITRFGLTGGGKDPKPGEISLAHNGVLFLDEFTEFQKSTIEVLRQPLEEGQIRLTRANNSVTYPADFLLLVAMNPCNCGYFPDAQRCQCTPNSRRRYLDKISQPLLDRIDICVEATALSYNDIMSKSKNETSAEIRNRVIACHEIEKERYIKEEFNYNNQIPAALIDEYCFLGEKERAYMEKMFEKMNLTARTYHKTLRVARTIADMQEEKEIKLSHLNEAICFRSITDKYWGGKNEI